MSLETTVAVWRSKISVTDTVVLGGDLAGGSPNGSAISIYRACALAPATDRIELDLVLDGKTNGNLIGIGLAFPTSTTIDSSACEASWEWGTDQHLRAFENGTQRADVGVIAASMACRIIYDSGALTWRSGNGADVLRFTSAKTSAAVQAAMLQGFSILAWFTGTGGSLHATLKAGTSVTPEIAMDGSTGRLGLQTLSVNIEALAQRCGYLTKQLISSGFAGTKPRPTEGKIWPRNF